ncbi:bestrophin-4-like [Anastrepha ludens]|uniref:bestrophin-4-like n=1 Tax=Anastrepha ludens TaxID=28586 RepID=UPI0023B0D96D|nr:bestrophin-4-like [Anastrepha ludens]
MTVSYSAEVASCSGFGCFLKLLRRWRGSIYKLIWRDLLAFLTIYYTLSLIYLFLLNDTGQKTFENLVHYCNSYGSLIPLSFVLGFYVTVVMQRWWDQYMTIPWPDPIAVFVSANVHGQDERARVMRRTVMRYVCLCLTIVFTQIAPRVKKRFPTLDHLVEAGLLLENEKLVIEDLDASFPKYPKYWLPIVWAASIITRARKEGRIRDDFSVKTIIDALNTFRGNCGVLLFYDTISVPLVYTQVVTLAVYTYFICQVIGHQWTKHDSQNYVDLYFPLFTTLQFFFYMGWLKVAETLINPFGEDDDDFEVNWMIDRNLQVSYLIVDEMHHEHPELVKDQYWDEIFPNELPYQADGKREEPPEQSTARLGLNTNQTALSRSESKYDGMTTSTRLGDRLTASSSISRMTDTSIRFRAALQRFMSNEKDSNISQEDAEKQTTPQANGSVHSLAKSPLKIRTTETLHIIDERADDLDLDRTLTEESEFPSTKDVREIFHGDDGGTMPPSSVESVQHESGTSAQVTFEDIDEDDEVEEVQEEEEDEFERLREERERERFERQKMKYARGISAATNLNLDADMAGVSAVQSPLARGMQANEETFSVHSLTRQVTSPIAIGAAQQQQKEQQQQQEQAKEESKRKPKSAQLDEGDEEELAEEEEEEK